jgi:hypothetical protein
MATIDDLRTLGFTVGLAHGSVDFEQQALEAAQAQADPNVVAAQAAQVTADTVQALDNMGKLPETPEERQALAAQIATAALDQLTERVTGKVAFHQAALAIAQDSPDVWSVQQTAGGQTIVQTYVGCKDDGTGWDDQNQEALDSLARADVYAEREYQALNPEAMQAAQTLTGRGRTVERELGADTFTVNGTATTGIELVALAEAALAEPSPKVGTVVQMQDGTYSVVTENTGVPIMQPLADFTGS